ncbi:MFS transporter [Alicyclobacillus sp. ALC3]|nr:MFS transporter [Alicyclobacillus sp. ALC3]
MFLTYGFVFMDRLSITFLFPFIVPALKLTNAQVGLSVSILSICWAVSSYLFSSLSDILNAKKRFLIVIILVFSLASVSTGLATTFGVLMLARAVMGVAEGPVVTLTQTAVVADSTPSRRGLNVGVVQSSVSLLGSTLGPLLLIPIAAALGWHKAFYLLAIPSFIVALVLMKYMREPNLSAAAGAPKVEHQRPPLKDYLQVFKHRNIWLGVLMSIGFMSWMFSTTTFGPLFYTKVDHMSEGHLSLFLTLMGLSQFVGQLIAPWVSDRIGRKPTMVLSGLMLVFSVLVLIYVHSFTPLLLWTILFGLGSGYPSIFMAVIPAESVPKAFIATAMSLIVLVGELGGGTVIPTVAGYLSDKYSLFAPLWLALGGTVFVVLLSFGLKETAPRVLRRRDANIEENVAV